MSLSQRVLAFLYGAFWAGLLSTLIGAVITALAHDWGFVPYGVGETAALTSSVLTGAIIGGIFFLWSELRRVRTNRDLGPRTESREEIRLRDE